MLSRDFFLINLWRWKCGLTERKPERKKSLKLEELRKTQWSSQFEIWMRNRLLMGAFRYAPFNKQKKGAYDCIGSIRRRLIKYEATGNIEYLVDSANLCMVEFIMGDHPKAHFNSVDDGEHAKLKE